MPAAAHEEVSALVELVRRAMKRPDLSDSDILSSAGAWTSHETLDILFGAEELCAVQFSSADMESVEGFEALVRAIAASRARA